MTRSILFDARLVIGKPTGIGRYVTSLLPELLRQSTGELHLHLLRGSRPWPGFGMAEWTAPNLTHHVSDAKVMSLTQHFWLPRLARRLGADLIHYPHFDAPVLVGRTPVVATIHDARDLARQDFFIGMSRLKRAYMHWFIARSLRRATVITVSHAMARDLGARFGVDPQRIPVTQEAADPAFAAAAPEQVRAFRKKLGLERPFVLCVGERRPHKNQAMLVRAFAQCRSRATHDLVIIGKVYAGFRLPEETAQQLGIADRVRVLDPVDAQDLVAAYTGADLFVLISLYEGFGLPVLEAMACGTPVIASSTTATGEVTGEGGVRVDPENPGAVAAAIDRMLLDEQERARWIARGRQWARRFTWERTASETLAIYRRILGAGN
jgi:alpha-1,3-rhamnosyl/mannosyltransferase